jgi:osmotically-inducible protein OsmY
MARHTIKIFTIIAISAISALSISACDKQKDSAPALHANGTLEVSDADLTTDVQRALIGNDELKDFQITAKSQKGDVLLTGVVVNQEQYDLAASVSSGINGVHTIHNEIVIGN